MRSKLLSFLCLLLASLIFLAPIGGVVSSMGDFAQEEELELEARREIESSEALTERREVERPELPSCSSPPLRARVQAPRATDLPPLLTRLDCQRRPLRC